jgi:enterochelin esterase-like enzyme
MNFKLLIALALIVPALFITGCRTILSEKVESRGHGVPLGEDTLVYRVYLPPGYEQNPEKTYPLLVWFHGGGGSELTWGQRGGIAERLIEPMKTGELTPFIVLSPTAGETDVFRGETERALVEKVLPRVKREYRTNDVTVALGHSMGGLNAMIVSLRNPQLFSAVAVASPFLFDTSPYDSEATLEDFEKRFGAGWQGVYRRAVGSRFETRDEFEAYDPFSRIRSGQAVPFELLLTSGTEDRFGLFKHNEYLHETLKKRGIAHQWFVQQGVGHTTIANPEVYNWLGAQARQARRDSGARPVTSLSGGGQ